MKEIEMLKMTLLKMKTMYELRETSIFSTHEEQVSQLTAQLHNARDVLQKNKLLEQSLFEAQKHLTDHQKDLNLLREKCQSLEHQKSTKINANDGLLVAKVKHKREVAAMKEQIESLKRELTAASAIGASSCGSTLSSKSASKEANTIRPLEQSQMRIQLQYEDAQKELHRLRQILSRESKLKAEAIERTNELREQLDSMSNEPPSEADRWKQQYEAMNSAYDKTFQKVKDFEAHLLQLGVQVPEFSPPVDTARSNQFSTVRPHRPQSAVLQHSKSCLRPASSSGRTSSPHHVGPSSAIMRPKSATHTSRPVRFRVRAYVPTAMPVQGNSRPLSARERPWFRAENDATAW